MHKAGSYECQLPMFCAYLHLVKNVKYTPWLLNAPIKSKLLCDKHSKLVQNFG